MSRRTRNRELARLAARRRAEKRHAQRRRQIATIAVALVVAVAGAIPVYLLLSDDDGSAPAASGPTGTSAPTGATGPTAEAEPGVQTGTVEPDSAPDDVACGAEIPRGATRRKPQFGAPAQVLEDGVGYTATFSTSCGDIVIELLAEEAPETVNSFVFLAGEGYFDGTRIHRLDESIDVIQGGDPTGTGTGSPGYTIPDELSGSESYGPGTLAMANGGPGTGGSQFFLITGPDGHNLDSNPAYTIFGRVVEGMSVARRIQGLEIQDPEGGIEGQQPVQAVYLERVTITTDP